ncbi:hypothetical protein [Micromonospora mirobrigensis]|uniref:Uncharacterized protein n=1 Tax=Micromonospora mirobrigensis TaxID=262898 RepID=A0A1C4WYK2_9ACTN|nr:hypothetical protein [Micromonospora mirobrigensis]SCF01258.1 hypothetical protein GA0070564_102594 [Micromonospora mirobrigensis]
MSPRTAPHGARQDPPPADGATGWITGAVPDGWFAEPPQIVIDRDEIIIWGRLPEPQLADDATDADRTAARSGRIHQFREDTRDDRIRVARQAEHRYRRKVSWGVRCGDAEQLFSHLAAPVMTRLRQPERQILDTLVDAGVARSRSEALAWCVRLVGRHTDDWLSQLRQAMSTVDDLRRQGPDGL